MAARPFGCFLTALLAAFFILISPVSAQTPCGGDIIIPANNYTGQAEERTPIADCSDPFVVTNDVADPYTVVVDGQPVAPNGTALVPGGRTTSVTVQGTPYLSGYNIAYYKHDGADYRQVRADYEEVVPTEVLLVYADEYFADLSVRALYKEIISSNDPFSYFTDENGDPTYDSEGEVIEDRYQDFYDSALYSKQRPFDSGTYTAVVTEYLLVQTTRTIWDKVFQTIIPTAYANHDDGTWPRYVFAITFTVAEENAGASSILFLPGIMGSRLYEMGQQCNDFGQEQERWYSITDCEQERLFLDEQGNSQNDIYTKFDDDAIAQTVSYLGAGRESLYKDFIERMSALENKEFSEFKPFPYDWRLRLDQQLQTVKNENNEIRYDASITYRDGLLYQLLSSMARLSYNGKVTIVAHSNGGLVAKTLMQKLQSENDPLAAKIDNIILVGSPQVGTPDAITGILQGTEIGGGYVVSQKVARQLLNDAPFGYHLLPNQQYFDGVGVSVETPVIVFDEGTTTKEFRDRYGADIDNFAELKTFIGTASERTKPSSNDLYTPEVGNDTLLTYAEDTAIRLASWNPQTTKVYQLAGTGMWTPKTLRYFSGEVCDAWVPETGACTHYKPQLMHENYFTRDGDGTVVIPSAVAMPESGNVSRVWLDLDKFAKENDNEIVHRNMMEIDEVSAFVRNIASGGAAGTYRYIGDTNQTTIDEHHLVYRLHSPLDMFVTSDNGVLSSSTNTIRGAMYRRLGETQYLILPADIQNAVLHLIGVSTGSFTLVAEDWQGDAVTPLRDYRAIPTATTTRVLLDIDSSEQSLQIDLDGDGLYEGIVTHTGDRIEGALLPVVATVGNTTQHGGRPRHIPLPQVAGVSTDAELAKIEQMIQLLQQIIQLMVQLKNL
jgi:pimeloyl-ACP methyl ester carboxylesterase